MITAGAKTQGPAAWQQQMREAWRDPAALLADLDLDPEDVGLGVGEAFPFLVTRAFADRMRPGDPEDPLLRQVLPAALEERSPPGFGSDPVGDAASRPVEGVLHKYHGRALLVVHGACPIHCRYCFRREFDYAEDGLHVGRLRAALDYIASDPDITEVILSGGDPLMLNDRRLGGLTDAICGIDHVRRIRIHSRVPVVLPARIDEGFARWLAGVDRPVVVVVHANHAREFGADVFAAMDRLRGKAVAVFNQAVLLAGVNDSPEALVDLMETSFSCGVIPYYLHLLDRVAGSAHFEVDARRATLLVDELRRKLPGYLVPRLVRERAGEPYKLPVF
ncbi:MAG: EF-P beta-lysylation protein EpmB [Candidatus Wenzhouxiangella sp. M2_3B_020]